MEEQQGEHKKLVASNINCPHPWWWGLLSVNVLACCVLRAVPVRGVRLLVFYLYFIYLFFGGFLVGEGGGEEAIRILLVYFLYVQG